MPGHDVRMSGFRSRSTVEEAWDWIETAAQARTSTGEVVPIQAAYGRVLAEAVRSLIDVPGFDRSAMDGYAVRAGETVGAGEYSPILLRIVGESLPGQAFQGAVGPGEAVRIMTGAPIPAGADAVVPAEHAREAEQTVELTTTVGESRHVGRRGEDVPAGTVVLAEGRMLRPQDVAVLASIGRAEVSLVPVPRVRVIVTGNELAQPGTPRQRHQIYEANSYLLRGLIPRDGGEIESVRFVSDQREEIGRNLLAPGADVILISGGSSVGAEDYAPLLIREQGELAIHGIAMRPSSPTGIGRVGEALVFLLPGNPVSCLCAYDFFAGRAIRTLGARSPDWPYARVRGRLRRKIVSSIGRTDYCRVRTIDDEVEPLAISGASILSSTTRADGFVIIPAESEGLAAGSVVEVLHYG